MSITRGQLRRRIGGRLGDVTDLIATVSGTTTRLTDTIRLNGSIEKPTNREIVFTSGTNLGTVRRVTAYDLTSCYVDFAAIPLATAAADTAEMYNFRGRGWRIPEIDDAINQAVSDAFPSYREPYLASVVATFSSTTGLITVPATFTHIYGLHYQDSNSLWQPVQRAANPYGQGWYYDKAAATVVVRGTYSIPDGSTLRLVGFKQPTALTTDSSTTNINAEWLTLHACEILCLAAIDRDSNNYNQGLIYQQQAQKKEASIRTRLPSGTVAVA